MKVRIEGAFVKYGEESFHLRSAFRQMEHGGREGLIRRIRETAFDLLARYAHKDDSHTDHDCCILLALAAQSDPESKPGERAAADLLRACVHWALSH